MLIRFFKENDLIGCVEDPQPIRLQVHVQGCIHKGACAGVCMQVCTRVCVQG